MGLFGDADKQRIEAAIGELERRTAAEVVVAVVPHCGRPWLQRALAAFCAGQAVELGLFEHGSPGDPFLVLALALLVTFGVFALFGWHPLERLLVAPAVARAEVEARAFAVFSRHGLYRTRGHTGVLILLSELERRAVILGDTAIHDRLGDAGWQAHIERIVAGIRGGEAARGVLDVLASLGDVLAEIAPPAGDNDNELPNRVLEEG